MLFLHTLYFGDCGGEKKRVGGGGGGNHGSLNVKGGGPPLFKSINLLL